MTVAVTKIYSDAPTAFTATDVSDEQMTPVYLSTSPSLNDTSGAQLDINLLYAVPWPVTATVLSTAQKFPILIVLLASLILVVINKSFVQYHMTGYGLLVIVNQVELVQYYASYPPWCHCT